MSEQQAEQQKITRFRPDRRGGAAHILRTLALLGMLGCVLFAIWRYQDDLTPENFKRIYQYMKAGSDSGDFSEYAFESGLNTVYVPFRSGLAVSSGDTYYYVSGRGDARFSLQLKYQNPAITAGDRFALIYDLGNYGLCVAGTYAEYLNLTLESPILAAQMNREGAFAVVTSESGYRSAVTVFSARQRQLCKWNTAQYYVRAASVSPDGERFAALCLEQVGLEAQSRAVLFTIGQEEPDCVIDLGARRVYALCHDKTGALLILCEDGLDYYGPDGALLGRLSFPARPAEFFMAEGEWPLLAFSASDADGQRTLLLAAGEKGAEVWRETISGALRGLARRDGAAAVLMNDRLLLRDLGAEEPATRALTQTGARAVLAAADGSPILIYSDRAEKVDLEDQAWN